LLPADLKDPGSLAARLRDGKDPLSQYLRQQFAPETQQLLHDYSGPGAPSAALTEALLNDLNRVILAGPLYEPERYAQVVLTDKTACLLQQEWSGKRLARLNRTLLAEAYPNEIIRSHSLLREWTARRDLLSSQNQDNDFVVELDNDGLAHLRFGNGELGRLPEAGTTFTATYRVGNGLAGNVGAEAISYLGLRRTTLSGVTLRVRNPFPAQGGIEPEPLAEVKLFAPYAFRTDLQRAITAADYAHLVERDFESKAQRAAAALRWTGSWYEAQVAIDQRGKQEADQDLLDAISARLRRYRRIGHDLAVASARHVALDIVIEVCVLPHYLRGHVKAALLDIFSNRPLGVPDGRRGFFHPDNLTFGEGIYLSKLVAAAQAVTGVESVRVTRLKRRFEGPNGEIESGFLPLSPMEIAQLDNDPSFPEQGILVLDVRGGR
jgi:predicted phage baseplate assembly protein